MASPGTARTHVTPGVSVAVPMCMCLIPTVGIMADTTAGFMVVSTEVTTAGIITK